jgi:hypothetical protein
MVEQIPILSADSAFDAYPIQRLWEVAKNNKFCEMPHIICQSLLIRSCHAARSQPEHTLPETA